MNQYVVRGDNMIKIYLFSDSMTSIDYKVNKYVNDNLKVMIEVYRDYIFMEDGFSIEEKLSDAFPREFIKQNNCTDIIDELYEIISSRVIRGYIKPKYEASLYYIMEWWTEIQDCEEDCIPVKIDEELLKEIIDNTEYVNGDGENIILNAISDISRYFGFCFEDTDFLTDSLDSMVELYLDSPEFVDLFFHIDLDDYIGLMSADMRELYIEKRDEIKNIKVVPVLWSEEVIIKELYNCLSLLSNHVVEIRDKSEVEISNEIFRMLKRFFKVHYGIEVERESEIGHSNKKLGENDFYLYENGNEYINIAIGENKLLSGFEQAYGQLLGYLNINFKFGFTISINKDKSLKDAYQYIIKQIKTIKYDEFNIVNIDEEPYGKELRYLIKSVYILPEDSSRQMNLYHLILDLNDNPRNEVAKTARKK